jgi:hypothetical protein
MIFALLIRPDYIYNLVYLIDSETDLEPYSYEAKVTV